MSTHPTASVGQLLGGRYMLLSPIAQGGMGEVWKARDSVTGRLIAAKVLRSEFAGEELSLSRLRIEALNAMSVQHPNIANVQDSGEENGRGWIIMELVEGLPLTHYLRGGSRIQTVDLLPILIQIAMALGAAAKAGVVHRDIKPANIIVRPDGMVKLTDFGISRAVNQIDLTAAGMVMGTAQYLPPEQAMGERASSSGDLYALGVIAYEAAAGHRPFTGDTQVDIAFSHVNDPVPPLPNDVPRPFADVILHLLEKDPAKRPDSGLAVVRELSSAAKAMGISVEPHALPDPSGSTPRAAFPAVSPVVHTQRRTLPEDLLRAPAALDEPMDSPATFPVPGVSTSRNTAPVPSPLPANELAANEPAAQVPPGSSLSAHADASESGSASAQERRAMLMARLNERARARQMADVHGRPSPEEGAAHPTYLQQGATPSLPHQGDARPASSHHSPAQQAQKHPATLPPLRRSRSRSRTYPAPSALPGGAAAAPWRSVSRNSIAPHVPRPIAPTPYNRSQVAPPLPLTRRLLRLALVLLLVLALLALGGFALYHLLGSLSSTIGATAPTLEEVPTWLSPWHTV